MHPLKTSKDPLSGPPETLPSAPGDHSGPLSSVLKSADLSQSVERVGVTCKFTRTVDHRHGHSGPFSSVLKYS